mgnify:CR=1 FL=1
MFFIFISLFTLFQETINLKDILVKKNNVEIKELITLDGGDDGFYDTIDASMSDNGHTVIFDKGNIRLHVYDSKGLEISQFGKEGNGPLELSDTQLFLIQNTIIMLKRKSCLLFNLKGVLIKEIKTKSIKKGKIIAYCGNSGRSPQPHIHFQIQSEPYFDSKTLDYPIGNYILNENSKFELKSFDKPQKNDIVSNKDDIVALNLVAPNNDIVLMSGFNFSPIDKNEPLQMLIREEYYFNVSELMKAHSTVQFVLVDYTHELATWARELPNLTIDGIDSVKSLLV